MLEGKLQMYGEKSIIYSSYINFASTQFALHLIQNLTFQIHFTSYSLSFTSEICWKFVFFNHNFPTTCNTFFAIGNRVYRTFPNFLRVFTQFRPKSVPARISLTVLARKKPQFSVNFGVFQHFLHKIARSSLQRNYGLNFLYKTEPERGQKFSHNSRLTIVHTYVQHSNFKRLRPNFCHVAIVKMCIVETQKCSSMLCVNGAATPLLKLSARASCATYMK